MKGVKSTQHKTGAQKGLDHIWDFPVVFTVGMVLISAALPSL